MDAGEMAMTPENGAEYNRVRPMSPSMTPFRIR